MVAQVIIQSDTRALDRCFSYTIPKELEGQLQIGMQVLVPFGKGDRQQCGVLLSFLKTDETENLKPILAIAEETFCPKSLLPLVDFLREETFCTYQDALRVLMPPGSRKKAKEKLSLAPNLSDAEIAEVSGHSVIYRTMISLLQKNGTMDYATLCAQMSRRSLRTQVDALVKKGVLSVKIQNTATVTEKKEQVVSLAVSKSVILDYFETNKRAVAQKKQAFYLLEHGSVSVGQLLSDTHTSRSSLNVLVKMGFCAIALQTVSRVPAALLGHQRTKPFEPTEEQSRAIQYLKAQINSSSFSKTLLFGVTGSGKTEVFLQAIEHVIAKGKQAIVLVPEISLTPQMVQRFVGRFGDRVAVLHSVLSNGERYDQWKKIEQGEVDVVVGARSAVFAPCPNLGMIVVDEEHDSSYKSENSPRYHARDVAAFRGKLCRCPVLLSSATPSVESFYEAQQGDAQLLTLTMRSNAAALPNISVVDMRQELLEGNRSILSRALASAIEETHAGHKQSILFLNKRGYASFVSCRSCGEAITCPNCSITLTYHAVQNKMVCHYCDYQCSPPKGCPSCHSPYIRPFGVGTQKVEALLKETYPELETLRMDSDTIGKKESSEKILDAFANHQADILLGTQMIAKGLDFPDVTLVGVLAADLSLHIDDYRSRERTFQILTQVCGRSGRGVSCGNAIIQSYAPEDETIQYVKNQDYLGFYESELALRKLLVLPPFSGFFLIQITAEQEEIGRTTLKKWVAAIQLVQRRGELSSKTCQVLSAGESPIMRIGGKYRFRILLKSQDVTETRRVLHRLHHAFFMKKQSAGQTVTIDYNPNSIL